MRNFSSISYSRSEMVLSNSVEARKVTSLLGSLDFSVDEDIERGLKIRAYTSKN